MQVAYFRPVVMVLPFAVVFINDLDLTAQNAAVGVDLLFPELGAFFAVLAVARVRAGKGGDDADANGIFASGCFE